MINNKIRLLRCLNEIKNNKIENFDFILLKQKVANFYNRIMVRSFNIEEKARRNKRALDAINSLLEARNILDSCISQLKSNFELEYNTYIQTANKNYKSYQGAIVYLGIANARIDILSEEMQGLEKSADISGSSMSVNTIKLFRETISHFMENFIISSLHNAIVKFKRIESEKVEKEGEKEVKKIAVKDSNLFYYLLFLEFYRVCETEGAIARQTASSGKTSNLIASETKEYKIPNILPEDLKYEKKEEAEEKNQLLDPFIVTEEEYV